jgi:A/G-specific adenine glycosylase
MPAIVTGSHSRPKQGRATLPPRARGFRRRLLAWYGRHRRNLPWRGVRDPYAVLVSEMMLQQTQVSRVLDFYPRFLARYPTLEDLAAAPPDAVRESWDGLGYYARARNLHAAARHVVTHLGGVLPREHGELCRLPGIGRYTAGAVASLAFGADVPAVDTNAARVLARVFGVPRGKRTARRDRRIWSLAAALVPSGRSSDWNQALMDLGATLCTARTPRCRVCPVRPECLFGRRSSARARRPVK